MLLSKIKSVYFRADMGAFLVEGFAEMGTQIGKTFYRTLSFLNVKIFCHIFPPSLLLSYLASKIFGTVFQYSSYVKNSNFPFARRTGKAQDTK